MRRNDPQGGPKIAAILANPAESLLARLASGEPRWIIGMAGLPGSGKSTLAAKLAEEVNARSGSGVMAALGMDGFHLSKAELRALPNAEEAFARRGAPWTFNPAALLERLQALRPAAGREDVGWPSFVHEFGDPVENAVMVPASARLILVEGLYLLRRTDEWDAIRRFFDERWYLDTLLDTAIERLTLRHMGAYAMTREAAAARIASNDRLNADTVLETRKFADWQVVS